MNEKTFEIKIPEFEGPFDLLLFFIEREELNIHDVSLSAITKDFLNHIQKMQELNIEIASEFIFVAATLMRIKAKTLIPKPMMDEDGDEIDLQKELIQRLIVYRQFKKICEELRVFEERRSLMHCRGNIEYDLELSAKENRQTEELGSFDLYKLMKTYDRVMGRYEQKVNELPHVIKQYPYTIEQQKKAIASLLEIDDKLTFYSILHHSENKVQFVYNFLAILEMLQQQVLELQSGLGYNNFWISSKNG